MIAAAGSPESAIVVIVSGTGTNLQALIDACVQNRLAAQITAVFSDRADALGLERARTAGIQAEHVPVESRTAPGYDRALCEAVIAARPGLVVLAGYMRILSPDFVRQFSDRLINIHPSLLPRHRGLDTHRRAIDAGDTVHGATVHFVVDALDAGPRIVQYRTMIRPGETPAALAQRVLQGEHMILTRAVTWFATGRLRLEDGDVILDGRKLQNPIVVEDAS